MYILKTKKRVFYFLDHQGGPTLDQRFESYYNYCNLFNYILSKWEDYSVCSPRPQLSTHRLREFVFVYRCWWPRTSGAAKPVAVGHHWRVHLPGRVLGSLQRQPPMCVLTMTMVFLLQFQSFSQYRCKTAKKTEEEIEFLRNNPKIWNVHSVLNVLHSLVDKSNINRQLEVYTSGGMEKYYWEMHQYHSHMETWHQRQHWDVLMSDSVVCLCCFFVLNLNLVSANKASLCWRSSIEGSALVSDLYMRWI